MIARLDSEQRERLAEQDGVTVMEATYARTFQPWTRDRLLSTIDEYAQLTREGKPAHAALDEFRQSHVKMSEKLGDIEFVKDARKVEALKSLVRIRAAVHSRSLTEEQGSQAAARVACEAIQK